MRPLDDSPVDPSFNISLRVQIVDLLQRELDVTNRPAEPSVAQIALVDVMWLVCQSRRRRVVYAGDAGMT